MQPTELDVLGAVTAWFFKGLGNVIRLELFRFLRHRDRAAGEVVKHLGLAQNQVSIHPRCLRWCGYVTTRREGRYVLYCISDPGVMEIESLVQGLLMGSEVNIVSCEIPNKCLEAKEGLADVTGWINGRAVLDSTATR